jgi:Lipoprotein LpqB beta-propeller domain/Sporulation and spore germination
MRRRAWLALPAVLLMLVGCTGVPTSSAPQVVRSAARSSAVQSPQTSITPPQPGEGPNEAVSFFLNAGVDADAGHSSSRQFLSTDAARRWQDNQTVILDPADVGEPTFSNDSAFAFVQVTGRRVGQLDATGVFTPILKRMGTGDSETFNFKLIRQAGEWRIDQLPPGVLISASQFQGSYRQHPLYFFDSAQSFLVPDLRYTPLRDQALASWLLTQLLAGPRPELAQTVINEVPDQVGKSSVQVGDPTTVELPGTTQLKPDLRNRLATQLAYTLVQIGGGRLELTDAGKPVSVPASSGVQFSAADFLSANPRNVPGGDLYFIHAGAVLDSKGDPLPNLLGRISQNFSSVALRGNSVQSLLAAGLTTGGQLLIGDGRGLTPVRLPQPAASRPEWRPSGEDAWLGAGNHGSIYRVTTDGRIHAVSVTSQVGVLPSAPITALRFSSDGDRLAFVIRGADGNGTAWIGSVVTSEADVRVESVEPLTPPALSVVDLAWADPTRLRLVAAAPGAEAQVWDVFSDGSNLRDRQANSGLAGPPTAITAAVDRPPVVSAAGAVWVLDTDGHWVGLSGTSAGTPGVSPVYAL